MPLIGADKIGFDYPELRFLYNIWPDPIDYQHPGARYLYQTQKNGWYVFSRVNIRVYSNFNTFKVETSYEPIPGEFMISADGNTVVCRDGTRFDTPITKETADLLAKKQNEFIMQAGNSGGTSGNNNGYVGGSSDSNSSGSTNKSLYTKCNSCNGTGICSGCRGERGEFKDTGYYAGNGSKTWVNCGSCKGSGKCPICYGRGKL